MPKTFSPTPREDEFLQNVLQNFINLGEPRSEYEISRVQSILSQLREPYSSSITLADRDDEILQTLLQEFFNNLPTFNNTTVQTLMIQGILSKLREP